MRKTKRRTSKSKRLQPKPYRVGRAPTGLGLFATAPISTRSLIIEYRGRRIPTSKAQEMERRRANRYLFEINKRWTIDGSSRRNLARYINHACKPNAEAELLRGRMMIRAIADIAPGEEITFDYGEEYLTLFFGKAGCLCKSCKKKKKRPT
jgi:SET domain-containing protein